MANEGSPDFFLASIYYRKRGSASYIVREVLLVREREREREREIRIIGSAEALPILCVRYFR